MQDKSDDTPENIIKRVEKPKTRSATSTSGGLFDTPTRDDTETDCDIVYESSDEVFTSDDKTNEAEAILEEIKNTSGKVQLLSPLYSTSPLHSPSSTSPSPSWKSVQKNANEIPAVVSVSNTKQNSAGPSILMAAPSSSSILPQSKKRKKIISKSGRARVPLKSPKKSMGIQQRLQKVRHKTRTKIVSKILDESVKRIKSLLLTNAIFGDSNSESDDETESSTTTSTESDDDIHSDDPVIVFEDTSENTTTDAKDDVDYELLQEINEKIANLNDLDKIQEVVDIVENCGRDLWTTESEVTFDFDLCKLSPEAIQKIKAVLLL